MAGDFKESRCLNVIASESSTALISMKPVIHTVNVIAATESTTVQPTTSSTANTVVKSTDILPSSTDGPDIATGTRARELIDSYPQTVDNYAKVIESLKQRFGRKELLLDIYVREFLGLVLHNATNPRDKMPLTKLYDQIESHIRFLDTLGVTSEKWKEKRGFAWPELVLE
ncbi:unnamed protein product [Allacma fusca]|uniref:Uncharacterized protein n=1 Tax=Allacma fusca TaxID=39272 RepID=A0A8J2L727_9HEXA|nr:unnamed protein product [Allacma fusca]